MSSSNRSKQKSKSKSKSKSGNAKKKKAHGRPKSNVKRQPPKGTNRQQTPQVISQVPSTSTSPNVSGQSTQALQQDPRVSVHGAPQVPAPVGLSSGVLDPSQVIPNIQPPKLLADGSTVEQYEHTYIEPDGTRVTKKVIIRRIPGSGVPVGSTPAVWSHIEVNPNQMSAFDAACFRRHNELRALHSAPPLKVSQQLTKYAQEWADHLAHHSTHYHRPNRFQDYGENIYWKKSPSMKITGEEAPNSWYEEIQFYDPSWYGRDPPKDSYKVCGHYTQLIWKSSQWLGVGLAINRDTFYVVANYACHGNIITRYGDNVLPLKQN